METFILIIIGALGITLGFVLGRRGAHKHLSSFANTERGLLKERRKRMLLKHLRDRGKLTNDEAQDLLGVSSTTIVTYFDELEEEGIVVQVGDVGSGVYYTLV